MKKVTINLPEDVARWVRLRAAQNDRSVSEWLAELIDEVWRREEGYEVTMDRFLERARATRKLEWIEDRRPSREDLHDCAGLR